MPEDWETVALSDLCIKICSGGTPASKRKDYYGGGIPWLNTKEVDFNFIENTEKTITNDGLAHSSAKWIKPNSVIVAMYGATAGRVAITKIPLTTNQACCNLEINGAIADYRFIYYWLKNSFVYVKSLANGGAQQNLNAQMIKDLEIRLPALKVQEYIADILSVLDNKIENNKRINHHLAA
ncbi:MULTISPECIES: restriction endonuclease subunit S [Streptococcaceae]|uniref:restriction endonuclease subunit S n=1 Tax=Streptococcaceae TaxID=1300 RepID=UPI0034CFA058